MNKFQDYETLTKKELHEMYKMVLRDVPDSHKKYELLSEILEAQIYKSSSHTKILMQMHAEIHNLLLMNKITIEAKKRIEQLQLIIRDLSEFDDFQHDETDYALIGLNTKKKFRMGDKIKIRVVAANLTKRQLDYEWVMEENLSVKKAKSKIK